MPEQETEPTPQDGYSQIELAILFNAIIIIGALAVGIAYRLGYKTIALVILLIMFIPVIWAWSQTPDIL